MRRVRLIPFTVTIPVAERQRKYHEVLRPEHPGILAWAVRGCMRWLTDGLSNPPAIRTATEDYREEMDTLEQFIEEKCIPEEGAWVMASDIYKGYLAWCSDAGEKPISQRFLGLRMTERNYLKERHGTDRRWAWRGLRFRGEWEPYRAPATEADAPTPAAQQEELPTSTPVSSTRPPEPSDFATTDEYIRATRAWHDARQSGDPQ